MHHALALFLSQKPDYESEFQLLKSVEESFTPWELWEPCFGLSNDHDMMLLSEFPLVLTLLCVVFSPSPYAIHYSRKLFAILQETKNFTYFNIHGLIWLLLASRIANDRISFEFARSTINSNGGLTRSLIVNPMPFIDDEPDGRFEILEDIVEIVSFDDWSAWLGSQVDLTQKDFLPIIIDSFLVMNNPVDARSSFALFCQQRSIHSLS